MTDVIHVCRFPSQAVHILYYPQPRQIGTLWPKTKSRDFYLRSPAMTLQTKWTRTMSTLQESLYTLLQALKKQGFCSRTKGSFNSLTRISFSSSCSTVVVPKTRVFPRVSIPGTTLSPFQSPLKDNGENSLQQPQENHQQYIVFNSQLNFQLNWRHSIHSSHSKATGMAALPLLYSPLLSFGSSPCIFINIT